MAIKGKSRKRSRPKGPALPPKPQTYARKLHPFQRAPVRRAIVVVLGLAVILGGLRVWQNVARADDLRAYDRALSKAQTPLLDHLQPESPTYLETNVQEFTSGKLTPKQFKDLTQRWEGDFRAAMEGVQKLKPPSQLIEAQGQLVQGIDAYVGVARLYQAAALQREALEGLTEKKAQERIESQVQVILQHAREWRERADKIYDLGNRTINSYKQSWHVEPALPAPEVPQAPGLP